MKFLTLSFKWSLPTINSFIETTSVGLKKITLTRYQHKNKIALLVHLLSLRNMFTIIRYATMIHILPYSSIFWKECSIYVNCNQKMVTLNILLQNFYDIAKPWELFPSTITLSFHFFNIVSTTKKCTPQKLLLSAKTYTRLFQLVLCFSFEIY